MNNKIINNNTNTKSINWKQLKNTSKQGVICLSFFWVGFIMAIVIGLSLGITGFNEFEKNSTIISIKYIPGGEFDVVRYGAFCAKWFHLTFTGGMWEGRTISIDNIHVPSWVKDYGQIFILLFVFGMLILCVAFISMIIYGATIATQTKKSNNSNVHSIAIASIFLGMFTFDVLRRKINKIIDEGNKENLANNNSEFVGGVNFNNSYQQNQNGYNSNGFNSNPYQNQNGYNPNGFYNNQYQNPNGFNSNPYQNQNGYNPNDFNNNSYQNPNDCNQNNSEANNNSNFNNN